MLSLVLVLFGFDEASMAGAAYRDALEALKQSRYDDAVARLQEALRHEPRETDKLLYRDREGRHDDPYHPHLVWSKVRALQAKDEPNPANRVKLLREAVTHLELTEVKADAQLDALKRDLADAEKLASAPAPADDAAAAQRRALIALCDQERFEEALAAAEKAVTERAALIELIEERRRPVLTRYEQAMTSALEAVAVTSAVEKPDAIPRILQPALLPASVAARPGPRPSWYREFVALCEKQLPQLRTMAQEKDESVKSAARTFDAWAEAGADAGWLPAFRASAHLADVLRSSRLAALDAGADDARLERVLVDLEEAMKGREAVLLRNAASAPELRNCREGFVTPGIAQARKSRDRREARVRLRGDLKTGIAESERVLSDPARMGRPSDLRSCARRLAGCQEGPAWAELEPAVRARGLFIRGLLELMAAILDGGDQADLRDPLASLRAARDLDSAAGKDWEERLSPKLRSRMTHP